MIADIRSLPPRVASIAKLVIGNALVLVGLRMGINLLSLGVFAANDVRKARQAQAESEEPLDDDRWTLPVYQDKAAARQIFVEFRDLKTMYQPFIGWNVCRSTASRRPLGPTGIG